jgi:hypothetical protein
MTQRGPAEEVSHVRLQRAVFVPQYSNIKFTYYEVDLATVDEAVRRGLEGHGQLLGYRAMQQQLQEVHGLNVPRDFVYAVMVLNMVSDC